MLILPPIIPPDLGAAAAGADAGAALGVLARALAPEEIFGIPPPTLEIPPILISPFSSVSFQFFVLRSGKPIST